MGADTKMTDNEKKLTEKQEALLQDAFGAIQSIIDDLDGERMPTREFSLMLTRLEESEMWGQRAFAALGYEMDDDEDEDDEDEGDDEDGEQDEDGGEDDKQKGDADDGEDDAQ